MSQLIQMRRRIKTIETIRKITNAMRLIAMSGHSRLKHKENHIKHYNDQVQELYQQIKNQIPKAYDPLAKHIDPSGPELIILIGSHKGLCGNFNTGLFKLFESYIQQQHRNFLVIAIGKRTVDFIKESKINLLSAQEKFSTTNLSGTVNKTINLLSSQSQRFCQVTIISNILKTFFIQKPQITVLLPLEDNQQYSTHSSNVFEEYVWEQTPQAIINDLAYLYLEAKLHALLFQSLLAEQASRFISMDNSTRNAEKLLETSKLQYNKIRQAKITKEINELVSNL